ncbi:hypothetical protein HN873_059358 [Arachis hypogaea]
MESLHKFRIDIYLQLHASPSNHDTTYKHPAVRHLSQHVVSLAGKKAPKYRRLPPSPTPSAGRSWTACSDTIEVRGKDSCHGAMEDEAGLPAAVR